MAEKIWVCMKCRKDVGKAKGKEQDLPCGVTAVRPCHYEAGGIVGLAVVKTTQILNRRKRNPRRSAPAGEVKMLKRRSNGSVYAVVFGSTNQILRVTKITSPERGFTPKDIPLDSKLVKKNMIARGFKEFTLAQ